MTFISLLSIGVFFYAYVVIFEGQLPTAKLKDTFSCGEFHLLVYEYANSDGYLRLVNNKNKVLDEWDFHDPIPIGPIEWEKDCRGVYVSSDEARTKMRVDK